MRWEKKNMKVTIIGCGRVGSRLAMRLAGGGHQISILDENREAFTRLAADFPGITFQGSGLDSEVVKRTGIFDAEVVFALTGGDNRNLMIAQIFKHKFGVQRVVARLHDPV
ncbi:MAG TPA: TrkA family potassium uptake protein, partial [Abditibacteriaceae bacterium]